MPAGRRDDIRYDIEYGADGRGCMGEATAINVFRLFIANHTGINLKEIPGQDVQFDKHIRFLISWNNQNAASAYCPLVSEHRWSGNHLGLSSIYVTDLRNKSGDLL